MPRVKHYFENGQFVHITTRTRAKKFYLASDAAKEIVVQTLRGYEGRGIYQVLTYVVMENHFHMVVVVRDAKGVAEAIGRLKGVTSRRIGRLIGVPGPIWERRFDDNVIQSERELAEVIQYVHYNPVRAGLVDNPRAYLWSSAFEPGHSEGLSGHGVV